MTSSYISLRKEDLPDMTMTEVALKLGERHVSAYTPEELLEMLQTGDVFDIYVALGAIGKLKLKKALNPLKYIALYDDDLGIQEESIRVIRRIGGRKALDILEFLKTTDHKKLIEGILKHGADYKPY